MRFWDELRRSSLGAALEWAAGDPSGRTVHTFDARLAAASRREGFTVVPAPS